MRFYFLVSLLALMGCGSRELKQTVSPSFSSISQVTFRGKCVRCHSSLATYDGTMTKVTPGDLEGSDLYRVVNSGEMPQQDGKLSDAEIQAIRDWILAGAPQN